MFHIEAVQDLAWCDVEKTFFSCSVKYAEFSDFLPVGVNGVDQTAHIRELWVNGTAGIYGPIAEFVPPPEPVDVPPPPTAPTGELPRSVL